MVSTRSNLNLFDVLEVFYNLHKSIHSRIFSYNKFVSNFDVNGFPLNNAILLGNCDGFEFNEQHHKYI